MPIPPPPTSPPPAKEKDKDKAHHKSQSSPLSSAPPAESSPKAESPSSSGFSRSHDDKNLPFINRPSNVSEERIGTSSSNMTRSRSSKVAEGLIPIKLNLGVFTQPLFSDTDLDIMPPEVSEAIMASSSPTRRFSTHQSGKVNTPLADILPWEYQDYREEVTSGRSTINIKTTGNSGGSGGSTSPPIVSPKQSTFSRLQTSITALPVSNGPTSPPPMSANPFRGFFSMSSSSGKGDQLKSPTGVPAVVLNSPSELSMPGSGATSPSESKANRFSSTSHRASESEAAPRRSSIFKNIIGPNKDQMLLSRCIRVFDSNDTGHAIDIANISTDVKAIREKILTKIGTSVGAKPDQEYELYIRAKAFNSNRFIRDTSIDDLTLLEVCSSPDHPYRGQLEFDKKRHPRIIAPPPGAVSHKPNRGKGRRKKSLESTADLSLKHDSGEGMDKIGKDVEPSQNKSAKLEEFFGENVDSAPSRQRRRRRKVKKDPVKDSQGSKLNLDQIEVAQADDDDEKALGNEKSAKMSKLVDFFGENVATAANSKLADFFGEGNHKGKSKPRESKATRKNKILADKANDSTDMLPSDLDNPSPPKSGSKKLEAFFGDRPPQEMIAKNLEAFFPGLNVAAGKSTVFKDAVYESAQNKRISRLQNHIIQAKIIAEKRKKFSSQLQLDLGESITEGMESIFDMYDLGASRTSDNKLKPQVENLMEREDRQSAPMRKRPAGMNFKTGENNFIFATIDQEEGQPQQELSAKSFSQDIIEEETQQIETSETVTKHVEEMLNLPKGEEASVAPDLSASLAEFRESFAIDPDVPKHIDWVQGPLIGSGSFGKVFYGANRETGEIMAVKQVPLRNPSLDSKTKKKMLDALHMEIELLKDLDHNNIVRYLGYYTEKDVINVFLEYVSGGSVTSALALMGAFDEILVKSLIIQTLNGLEYLHEMLIIHRDIKGGNILIDDDGLAKISDFGISKRSRHAFAYQTNSVMSVQGTVYWMAPEVIKGKGYSAKVDIWSLGCVILEMLTCKHPWQNLDEIQTLWRLGRFDKPPIPADISVDAKSFLDLTFATDPKDRPTATHLMNHAFCIYNVDDLDFRAYKEAAIQRKVQMDLDDEEDDDDSDSEDEDEEEEEESEDSDDGEYDEMDIDQEDEDEDVQMEEKPTPLSNENPTSMPV